MNRRSLRGMTLMELIISIAVLSVVSTIGMSAVFGIIDSQRAGSKYMNLDRQAEQVFDQMRQDAGRILSPKLSGAFVTGTESRIEDAHRKGTVTLEGAFTLPVAQPKDNGGSQAVSVSYHLVHEPGKAPVLMRTASLLNIRPAKAADTPVSEAVRMMRVEFQDVQGQWLNEWKAQAMPKAFRVSLMLADENGAGEQIARKAVFPVHVE